MNTGSKNKSEHFLNKAEWRNDNNTKEGVFDVEDKMVGFFKTKNNVAVNFRAAWSSNVIDDITKIIVHGDKASLKLTTTFGFSTNRIRFPSLTLCSRAGVDEIDLPNYEVGDEYNKQVALIYSLLDSKLDCTNGYLDEVFIIVSVLEKFYHSASSSEI